MKGHFCLAGTKRPHYNLKYDPGTSSLDAPPPPREAQRPPGVEMSSCMSPALVDLCCRALDYQHVYRALNGPQVAALPCCSAPFLFSRFDSVWTPRPKHSRKRIDFDFLCRFSILFRHALESRKTCCPCPHRTCPRLSYAARASRDQRKSTWGI